jgi:hypothetical protein
MKLAGQNVEVNRSSNSGLKTDPSRLDAVLSEIDVDAQPMDIQPMNNSQSIRDYPSGTISFLFEKCSKAKLDDIVDEEETTE